MMVAERRGGYCFEHNLLLASALEHLGLQVERMLARVRVSGAPPEARPPTHLVLRVTVIPDKLRQFGLPGFEVGEDGRVRAV